MSAPSGFSSGEAGVNNPPARALKVNGGVWGCRSRVINNLILSQVAVQEQGKNCRWWAADG